jgi:hypothetical protein
MLFRKVVFVYCGNHTKYTNKKHCCCGKAIAISYSVCVSVALTFQQATSHASYDSVISKLAHFSTLGLSHKRHNFREEVINIKCVFLIFSILLFETLLILRRSERDIIINAHLSSRKLPIILVRF